MDKETLCVKRSKVTEMYAYNEDILKTDPTHGGARLLKAKLQDLFGDKCLPDNVDTLADNVDSSEPNVESKPRFKAGDRFRFKKNRGEIYTVDSICGNGDISFYEKDEDGMNRQCLVKADYIEPYTEPQQTEENMEEKELNLCEIFANCECLEEFYSPAFGKVTLSEVIPDEREVVIMDIAQGIEYSLNPYGCLQSTPHGQCVLFPSSESFLAHPLDARKAWEEWQEERKPTDFLVSWRREDEKLHGSDGFSRISLPDAETEKLIDSIKNVIESFRKNYEQNPQT